MRGGQRQVLYLLEALAAGQHEKEEYALAARPGSPLFEMAQKAGIDVLPWGVRTLREVRPNIVHAHDARSHTLAATTSRCPLVVTRRVAFERKHGLLFRLKYRRAAHIIAVSEHVKEILISGGIRPQKVSVIPDCVPLVRPSVGGDGVLALATADPQKGTDLVKKAALFGNFDVRFSQCLERDIATADLLLYITRAEGLGSAALLAMSAGVPVIASRVGGLKEVVIDGETGILVDNSPEQISAAVGHLLANRDVAAKMGEAGRRRVAEHFSISTVVERTRLVYDRVLSC